MEYTITVGELIAKLSKLPENAVVCYDGRENTGLGELWTTGENVSKKYGRPAKQFSFTYEECEEEDESSELVCLIW